MKSVSVVFTTVFKKTGVFFAATKTLVFAVFTVQNRSNLETESSL